MNPYRGIYVFPEFLTQEECTLFREKLRAPLPDATNFTDSGNFKNRKWVDQPLANSFYTRLLDFQTEDRDRKFLGANTLIMSGEYGPGNSFGLHTDTGLYYNRKDKIKSAWTLLIYLNHDFEGGTTSFYTDTFEPTVTIQPKEGSALVFDIDLWHKGDEVLKGDKAWIGCEIIGSF